MPLTFPMDENRVSLLLIHRGDATVMNHTLAGQKVLILASSGVEESSMSSLQRDLLKAGAVIKTVATEPGLVNSWNGTASTWGLYFPVDIQISQALGADFDILVVPNGSRSIQKLAANPHAERIVSSFVMSKKPMGFLSDAIDLLDKTGHTTQKGSPFIITSMDDKDIATFVGGLTICSAHSIDMAIAA